MLRGLLEIQEKQQKRAGTFFAKVKSVFRNQAAGSFKNSFKSSRGDVSTTASASTSPRPPSQEPPSASSSGKWSLSTPRSFRVPFLSRQKSDSSGLSRSRSVYQRCRQHACPAPLSDTPLSHPSDMQDLSDISVGDATCAAPRLGTELSPPTLTHTSPCPFPPQAEAGLIPTAPIQQQRPRDTLGPLLPSRSCRTCRKPIPTNLTRLSQHLEALQGPL